MSETSLGKVREARRSSSDNPARAQWIDELNKRAGLFGLPWPRLWPEPKRLSPDQRYRFQTKGDVR